MSQALRASGIPLFESVSWGTNLALFYETEHDLVDTCAGYFAAGLQAQEMCAWVMIESVSAEAARRALQDAVPDFACHEAAGGIALISGDQLGVRDGGFDASRVVELWHQLLKGASKNSMSLRPVRVCCPEGMILGDG